MTAAKHALAEGDFALAAQRLVYARDAEPRNAAVLRLLTTAYWQAGDYAAAARAVRDWIREEGDRPAPYRTAARIYEDMGSLSQALDAAEREAERAPRDARRVGAARAAADAPLRPRGRARGARARARDRAERAGPARPRAGREPARATSAPRSRRASRRPRSRRSPRRAWSRLAHALARTDRTARVPRRLRARARARPTTPRSATCATQVLARRRASSRASPPPR